MWARRIPMRQRAGFGKLEVLLVIAFLALLFQVFPTLWFGALYVLDVRNWGRVAWMTLNVVIVFALFALRFGPELIAQRREHRTNRRPFSAKQPKEQDKAWKELDLKQQKELFKRMQEARKKQVL